MSKIAGGKYDPFDMKKYGSTKWRHIDNPFWELKKIQKKINKKILRDVMIQLPANIIGGVKGKSIKDNAARHINQEMMLTVDIKNCFPRTRHKAIYKIWKKFFRFDENSARILTQLTTLKTHLPQGSPTSLSLSNLALIPLFEEVNQYMNKHHLNFTMFVDDITISGGKKFVFKAISPLIRSIQKFGYAVRSQKINKMPASCPQITTGIQTNKKISVNKHSINEIRKQIINLAKKEKPYFSRGTIMSRIGYIRSISPEKGEKLLEFANMLLPININIEYECTKKDQVRKCNGKNCRALEN